MPTLWRYAFRHRVIIAITDRAHRRPDASLSATVAKRNRGVLRALIGMVDDIIRPAPLQRHVESIEHHLGVQRGRKRPADNTTRIDVNDDRQIKEAGPRRKVRYVGNPQLIGLVGGEVAIHQIGRRPGIIAHRCCDEPPPRDAFEASRLHQPRNAFAIDHVPKRDKVGMDARCAIGAVRRRMALMDLFDQHGILPGTLRCLPACPCIVPAGGDTQHTAHRGNRIIGIARQSGWERRVNQDENWRPSRMIVVDGLFDKSISAANV